MQDQQERLSRPQTLAFSQSGDRVPRLILVFASAASASENVAGLPSIARAAREAALAARQLPERHEIVLAVSAGLPLNSWCETEIARVAPSVAQYIAATDDLLPRPGDLWLAGEMSQSARSILDVLRSQRDRGKHSQFDSTPGQIKAFHAKHSPAALAASLDHAGRQIVRSTVKPSDGIVSRHLNRPISTRITSMLLRMKSIRPIHATAVAGLTAVVMFYCLSIGTFEGLIAGAILFQIASVIDGVDGEIARATFRTSKRGATLDSLTDAATNLAFLFGLGLSLTQQGAEDAAMLGMIGFGCLSIGLILLGASAMFSGRPINFDALKDVVRQHQSPLADWLIWLTMRDFLAFASASMVVFGYGYTFLQVFVVGSCLWLMAVIGFGYVNLVGIGTQTQRRFRSPS